MTDGADLDRLAELVGIEPFYHDIWGNRREIGPATKRDLIQAMGFPAGTPEEAADSLYRLRERQWRRMLKPVFVLGDGDSPEIDFTVPAQSGAAGITLAAVSVVGLAGFTLVIAGIITQVTIIGVTGFLLMGAGAHWYLSGLRLPNGQGFLVGPQSEGTSSTSEPEPGTK